MYSQVGDLPEKSQFHYNINAHIPLLMHCENANSPDETVYHSQLPETALHAFCSPSNSQGSTGSQ